MFTPADREHLRRVLLERAQRDPRITGGAITGSAAAGNEDTWSDIDLAFGIGELADRDVVIADWTRLMYDEHGAVDHLDVSAGGWLYRVFLLASTLQVDLAFVAAPQFCARAPTFQLVFGAAAAPDHRPPPEAGELIGLAWLYALHVRSAIARGRAWQALHMINCMRDHVLALACLRHDLPAPHARGVDALPADVIVRFRDTVPHDPSLAELSRAFAQLGGVFLDEAGATSRDVAARIRPVVEQLVRKAPHEASS